MIISILLGKQIAAMLLMVLMGFAVVRLRILKAEDSRVLAALSLYVISPCMILDAFQVDFSPEIFRGILAALGSAAVTVGAAIAMAMLLRRPLKLDEVEQASAIYSNGANLIIPIVSYVFGREWVIYTSSFIIVQVILFWTHCTTLLRKDAGISIKKILLNINIVSIMAGMVLFCSGLRFPEVPALAMHAVGDMIGPMAMLVTGMLIGATEFRHVLAYKRTPMIIALRLIVFPLAGLAAIKICGLADCVENGRTIMLISFFAASAPCASTVVQMSYLYGRDGLYASIINLTSTLLCVFSMPVLAWIFQWAV